MTEHILSKEEQTEILNALNQAANNEVWTKSTILRVIGKQVCAVRDDFEKLINSSASSALPLSLQAETSASERVNVFVSLYCAKGNDLKNWERMLSSLPAQLISRPVYTDEAAAITLIKSKTNKENEAYLSVHIPANTIVPNAPDKPITDKLGQPLLVLKGKPLAADYEATFFHESGTYQYANGKLTKLT